MATPENPTFLPVASPGRPAAAARSQTIEPLDAECVRLHMTVSRGFLAKLDAVKGALSHSRPGANAEAAIEVCMDLLLADRAKRKGLVEKPRATARPVTSGAIPAAVKRDAWRRAGGRCEWPLDAGGVCGSTLRLELDHVVPRARGGPSTIDNVRVLCRVHNQLAARNAFGDAWMDRFGRRRTAAEEAPPPG
jgi:HNH endonuclease